MKIGIIGVGFVGSTVLQVCMNNMLAVSTYDIKLEDTKLADVLHSDICFVCVPTLTKDGKQDLSPMLDVLGKLEEAKYQGVVVHKCTVVPKSTRMLQLNFPSLRIVHNPEFLKERHAYEDFISQKCALLSGDLGYMERVVAFYNLLGIESIVSANYEVTEYAKYLHNTFLALKVAFANQFHRACAIDGVMFDWVVEFAASQGGIGTGHWQVPGPDGMPGFGGHCFPKDTVALLSHCPDMSILKTAWEYNQVIRPHDKDCNPIGEV